MENKADEEEVEDGEEEEEKMMRMMTMLLNITLFLVGDPEEMTNSMAVRISAEGLCVTKGFEHPEQL